MVLFFVLVSQFVVRSGADFAGVIEVAGFSVLCDNAQFLASGTQTIFEAI
jgi:hypothetical protein